MNLKTTAAAAIAAVLMAGGAQAATLTFTSNGPPAPNDCSGDFGTSPDCVYVSEKDYYFDGPGAVPSEKTDNTYTTFEYGALGQIVKYDFGTDDTPDFPTVSEISANDILGAGIFTFSQAGGQNSWTYSPNGSLATIFAFSVFGGAKYNVYEMNDVPLFSGGEQSATGFFAPNNPSGDPAGISHITFYGKELAPIPLPAAGWLMLAGIGGLAALRRRKTV